MNHFDIFKNKLYLKIDYLKSKYQNLKIQKIPNF